MLKMDLYLTIFDVLFAHCNVCTHKRLYLGSDVELEHVMIEQHMLGDQRDETIISD